MQQNVNTQPYTLENVISDVYYMLFRQKWKIILMGILGLVVAAGLWKISRSGSQTACPLRGGLYRHGSHRGRQPDQHPGPLGSKHHQLRDPDPHESKPD